MSKAVKYVQFSKKIVVFVCIAVTLVSVAAIVLCWEKADTSSISQIVSTYLTFATVVFVAYSGNSAVEKWLYSRSNLSITTTVEESENNG